MEQLDFSDIRLNLQSFRRSLFAPGIRDPPPPVLPFIPWQISVNRFLQLAAEKGDGWIPPNKSNRSAYLFGCRPAGQYVCICHRVLAVVARWDVRAYNRQLPK